ncbi:F-box domain-containing protein [Purpureocillium lavendulum]|uniref:F-box domain-containing protein n=1 Tax=Purpureocillium lavendulum TaxID=1247861 RepID=A0AB34FSC9_9HYPO|nr:F-box domain-containing protein [Purpureocillium lavendulum]
MVATKRRRSPDPDGASARPAGARDGVDDEERHDAKRLRSGPPSPPPTTARARPHNGRGRDVFSTVSDELLVRVLSFMDERTLLDISPVSRRFCRVAADSQLWRPHYYRRFILPRAHRIPGFRTAARSSSKLHYSGQRLMWADGGWGRRGGLTDAAAAADDDPAAAIADTVDWKKQYRLRHNWARGRCAVDEVPVHEVERSPLPEWQTLVKVVDGLAVTADAESGLRVWDLKTRKAVAQRHLRSVDGAPSQPTCLAVDDQHLPRGVLDISAGFEDGTFGIWRFDAKRRRVALVHRQVKSYFGELVAIAYGHPYVLTATKLGFITLYTFDETGQGAAATTGDGGAQQRQDEPAAPRAKDADEALLPQPRQLTSLKSHSTRLPLALSIRRMANSVVASIAYTFDAVGGWAIGVQDLDIKPSETSRPDVVSSRVAYSLPTQTRKSATPSPESTPTRAGARSPRHRASPDDGDDGPIRLCYSHPYLLATLPDNTLVLHLCTSTATSLSISPGIRLWGHTSGISDAEITPRGKAVSVSTRGDEIRVWELEGRVGGSSVEVKPRQPDDTDIKADDRPSSRDSDVAEDRKNWVGFDDEMVVVLKEARDGRESLMVYDFT